MQELNSSSFDFKIKGSETELKMSCDDILIEGSTTSLQIHTNLAKSIMPYYFDASCMSSSSLVALSGNSPFLFEKSLWEETRISIFENAIKLDVETRCKTKTIGRVGLGHDYCNGELESLFKDNVDLFEPIMPSLSDEKHSKVKTHNGTIWRWIRPVIGENSDGSPHIRVEQRVCSSSPSTTDDIANIAYYVGLSYQLALELKEGADRQNFETLRKDFYNSCQLGLEAKVRWLNGGEKSIKKIIREELIDKAELGLKALNVDQDDIDFYLKKVLKNRVISGQTGSQWQKQYIKKYGASFSEMTKTYLENQKSDIPVSEWNL
jgi:hypothetical protein